MRTFNLKWKTALIAFFLLLNSMSNYGQKLKLVVQDARTARIVKLKVGRSIGIITNTDTIKYDKFKDSLGHIKTTTKSRSAMDLGFNSGRIWFLSSIDTMNRSIDITAREFNKTRSVQINDIRYVVFPRAYDEGSRIPYFLIGTASLIVGGLRFVHEKKDFATFALIGTGVVLSTYVFTTGHWLNSRKYKVVKVE